MDDVVNQINVFVASPGGVELERDAVRSSAEAINDVLRPFGWQINVLGWEDRGPASGRAQSDINSDVDRCHVFVGILWNRWGTPTGTHTSGFSEEWTLARDRYRRSGAPQLWLYFKELSATSADEDPQIGQVRSFRREVEDTEIAFYKTFDEAETFTRLIHGRLFMEILRRSGLTRTEIGGVAIDWSADYDHEPVSLVPGGSDRQGLADELLSSRPRDAARILVGLADEVAKHGFADHAELLRGRACQALLAADESHDAVHLLRKVLVDHVWWMRFDDADHMLASLAEDLPPEFAEELRGWRACCRAVDDPAGSAARLVNALGAVHAVPLDEETLASWRVVLWRCRLHEGQAIEIINDIATFASLAGDAQLELALLYADAQRQAGHPDADATWRNLRLLAVDQASSAPESAAWIATRAAFDLVAQEQLNTAETAYTDAATRWSNAPGGQEQAALAFFSAQAAAQLDGSWTLRGWALRGIAAAQRSARMSFARRAEQLERQALHHRLASEHAKAVPLLVAALWCHERAGLLHGVLKDLSLLGDAYAADGDHVRAVEMYCRTRDRKKAEAVAVNASNRVAVMTRLGGKWPRWSMEARCGTLGRIGRSAPADLAARLVNNVTAALKPADRLFDNTQSAAADALAALALAVDDRETRDVAVRELLQLAVDDDYSLAKAGRYGLRMLADVGRVVDIDALIDCFAADSRIEEPNYLWIVDHLTTPRRVAQVREAALGGHYRALLALIASDFAATDAGVREYCCRCTKGMLASDLGKSPDGHGMLGLMALDANGAIAAACDDDTLQRAAADALLLYALETRWPMVNRVNAVVGLWPLLEQLNESQWLAALQPLACPDGDLDDEARRPSWEGWTRVGQLEATTLNVCARLAERVGSPEWLDAAVSQAAFDERAPMREAAWYAAGKCAEWFDACGARHALCDPSARVRTAALHAWRLQSHCSLPPAALLRLGADADIAVRLALVGLLKVQPDDLTATELRSDDDAYVRGIARRNLAIPD